MIKLCRVYDLDELSETGYTIFVDRLWPRGVKKDELNTKEWIKDVAPSSSLRQWFSHDPERWVEFKKEYRKELKEKQEVLHKIKVLEKQYQNVILVFAAKDPKHNHALILKEVLDRIKT